MDKYIEIKRISLQEFVEVVNSIPEKKASKRKLFWKNLIENGNIICPVTKKKVAYCSYDVIGRKVKSYHYNLRSEDGTLFTIDHIMPLSMGGKNHISNIQPMVMEENFKKGKQLIYV